MEQKDMEQKTEGKESINQIKDKVLHPKSSRFVMDRVPKNIVDTFKKFANEEFVGDYGLCFKSLVDNMLIEPQRFDQIYTMLEEHEKRLTTLEGTGAPRMRKLKRLSGKVTEIPLREE